jgi:hypothetical protein
MKSEKLKLLLLMTFAVFLLAPSPSWCASLESVPGADSVSAAQISKRDSVAPSLNTTTPATPPATIDSAAKPIKATRSPADKIAEIGDSILVLTNKTLQNFMKGLTIKPRGSRERGYGGCIGFSPGLFEMNMKPIQDLSRKVPEIRDIGFDLQDSYKMMSLTGGMLYGGLGNGMRIGLEGRGGNRSLTKDFNDTTFFLDISMGYGGLLLEKAFVAKDMNYIIGAVAGAGGIVVERNHVVGESGFSALTDNVSSDPDGSASATIMVLQLHAAFTYSVLPWIHIGLGGVMPMFFSTGGFQAKNGRTITDGFTSFNFGVQLRLMLGNLG